MSFELPDYEAPSSSISPNSTWISEIVCAASIFSNASGLPIAYTNKRFLVCLYFLFSSLETKSAHSGEFRNWECISLRPPPDISKENRCEDDLEFEKRAIRFELAGKTDTNSPDPP